jgi:hypothetical protein
MVARAVFSEPVRRTAFVPHKTKDDLQLLKEWKEPRVSLQDPWKSGTIVLNSDYDPFETPGGGSTDKAELWFLEGNDSATLVVKLSDIKAVMFPHKDNELANAGPFRVVRLIATVSRVDLQTTIMFNSQKSPEHDCAKFVDTLHAFLGPRVVPPLIAKTSETVHLFAPQYVLGIVVLSKAEEELANKAPVANRYGADYTFLFQPEHLIAVKRVLHREGIVNIMISDDQWNQWMREDCDTFVKIHEALDSADVFVYLHDAVYKRLVDNFGMILATSSVASLCKRIEMKNGGLNMRNLQEDDDKWLRANVPYDEAVQVVDLSDVESSDKEEDEEPLPQEEDPLSPPQKRSIDALVGDVLEEHKRMRAEWETMEESLRNDLERSRKQREAVCQKLKQVEEYHKGHLDELTERARAETTRAENAMHEKLKADQRAQEALNLSAAQAAVAHRALKLRVREDSGDQSPSMTLPAAGCTVCFDAVAEWACVPCGHIVACNECKSSSIIWNTSRCPLCNEFRFPENHGLLRVYTSGVCV